MENLIIIQLVFFLVWGSLQLTRRYVAEFVISLFKSLIAEKRSKIIKNSGDVTWHYVTYDTKNSDKRHQLGDLGAR